jgi:AAA domain
MHSMNQFFTSNKLVYLIEGPAGSGKTTIVQYILRHFHIRQAIGVTYTHKAKRVLRQRMPGFEVCTLSSLLCKFRQHSYVGAKVFDKGSDTKLQTLSRHLFILDEVSMVTDSDFRQLKRAVGQIQGKILAIGDACQIPAISQPLVELNGMLCKKECDIFTTPCKSSLLEIVRVMDKASPILDISRYVREHLDDEFSLRSQFPSSTIDMDKSYALFATYLNEGKTPKMIAYTNEAVEMHNRQVRTALEYKEMFEVGDILMSYQNIGYPKLVLENGADYKVLSVANETNGLRQGLKGWTLKLEDIDEETTQMFFFPDVNAVENKKVLAKLLQFAQKVNAYRSTSKDYAMYKSLKDKLMMIHNVFEYPTGSGCFHSENVLRRVEPLLFTLVSSARNSKVVEEKLELIYGSLVRDRLHDDKEIGDSETFASAFCIFEKDLDYGYACTAHKSQGSTMDVIFVDEPNFDRMKNRVDERTGLVENKVKERNQLKYVACTRASESLYIMTSIMTSSSTSTLTLSSEK